MLASRYRTLSTFAVVLLSLCIVSVSAVAPSALAAGQATVTVRVIGPNDEPLLPLTQVTTNETPVVKDDKPEDACSGTSAAGALQLATEATKGSWSGTWSGGLGYFVDTIDAVAPPGMDYWSLWLNNKFSDVGVCDAQLESGEQILFLPQCEEEVKPEEFVVCKNSPSLLAIEVPASVEVNKPVTVTVLSYPDPSGAPVPAVNATVVGGGDADAAPTNEKGQTTLIFSGDGKFTVSATGDPEGAPSIPAEAFVCAHEGNDGTCGTPAPSNSSSTQTPVSGGKVLISPEVEFLRAAISGVKNGHVYSRRRAPRVLSGTVRVPAGGLLRSVRISLKRQYRGHCFDFSGRKERFVGIRCKRTAAFFSVGAKSTFSYLLPARLPRGRYTYEVQAVDGAGHTSALTAGVSRVTFDVK